MVFGCALTVVEAVAELLAEFGSGSVAPTVAVLDRVPGWTGVTLMVTVADPPLATDPSAQLTLVVPEHDPWLAVAEVKITGLGRGSVTTTLVAPEPPALATVRV